MTISDNTIYMLSLPIDKELFKSTFIEANKITYEKLQEVADMNTIRNDNKYYKAKIIKFQDPYEWETGNSIAQVELTCGCTEVINTSWLEKI